MENNKMKLDTKATFYLDKEARKMLDELYANSINKNDKRSLSWFVNEAIKVLHFGFQNKGKLKND